MRPDFGSKHCNISIMESNTKKTRKTTMRKDHGGRQPLKIRKFRGFKELVPDPFNLGV